MSAWRDPACGPGVVTQFARPLQRDPIQGPLFGVRSRTSVSSRASSSASKSLASGVRQRSIATPMSGPSATRGVATCCFGSMSSPPQPLLPETVDVCGPLDRELTRIIDSHVLSAIARKARNAGRRKYTQVRWVHSVTPSGSVEASMATGSISTQKSCMPRSNTARKIAFTSPNGCWIAAHVTPDPRAGHPAYAASRCWAHRSGAAGPSRTYRDPRFTGRPGFRTPAGRRCSGGAACLGEGSRGRLSELGPAAEQRGPAELRLPGSCERGLIASQSRPVGERRAVARRSLDEDRGRLRPL